LFAGNLFRQKRQIVSGNHTACTSSTRTLFLRAGQCVRCALCCPVTNKFAPRGAIRICYTAYEGEASVGCPSGNVVGRSVRVPETIGSHRLAPAIQKLFAFQAKLVDMVGTVATIYLKYLTALLLFLGGLPRASGRFAWGTNVYLSAHMAFFLQAGQCVRYALCCPVTNKFAPYGAMLCRYGGGKGHARHYTARGARRQGAQVTANAGTCATYDREGIRCGRGRLL
jgi:hypothetical protein